MVLCNPHYTLLTVNTTMLCVGEVSDDPKIHARSIAHGYSIGGAQQTARAKSSGHVKEAIRPPFEVKAAPVRWQC